MALSSPAPGCSSTVKRQRDRKSTRLNSSHGYISYAVFCLKKKKKKICRIMMKNKMKVKYIYNKRSKIQTIQAKEIGALYCSTQTKLIGRLVSYVVDYNDDN